MTSRFASITFAPLRERFAIAHRITPDDTPTDAVGRLLDLARQPAIPPDQLTMVTASTIQEFLGLSLHQWRWLVDPRSNPKTGAPPPPRQPGAPQRQPGASDLWLLELDIIPWLARTPDGMAMLERVLGEIIDGRTRPVFERRESGYYPKIVSYERDEP